ncbi:MAG: DUF4922 domain-containing protein [Pirellulales bacterium]
MRWELILQNDPDAGEPLRERIEALFAQQCATWPALREGDAALRNLATKTLVEGGERIVVQLNPARRRSTHAKTDVQSIATRACFLCPENMPPEERGIAFENLVVLPNPYPVLPLHCTIADREHRPQELAGRVDLLLRLAAAIGPDLAALYHGARCGASAPDHLHFQASSAAEIPILAQLPALAKDHCRTAHHSFGRAMLVFASPNAADVQSDIERTIDTLRRLEQTDDEPMFNLVIHFQAGRYCAVLFPRRVHRPSRYFSKGPDQLAVSPAVLEMSGVLVTTDPAHFARIDADTARSIYSEVGLTPARFEQLAAELT